MGHEPEKAVGGGIRSEAGGVEGQMEEQLPFVPVEANPSWAKKGASARLSETRASRSDGDAGTSPARVLRIRPPSPEAAPEPGRAPGRSLKSLPPAWNLRARVAYRTVDA